MASFKKGDSLDTSKLKREKFKLPECGDGVYLTIRALTAPEVDEHIATGTDGKEKNITGYKLLYLCAVNDDGSQMFDGEDDARLHLKVSAESLAAMVKRVLSLSGLDTKDREKN